MTQVFFQELKLFEDKKKFEELWPTTMHYTPGSRDTYWASLRKKTYRLVQYRLRTFF